MDMHALRDAIRRDAILNTQHAIHEANADALDLDEVWAGVLKRSAEVIEEYPTDPRGPSCLILCHLKRRPVHCVVAYPSKRHAANLAVPSVAVLITVYRPDARPQEWTHDYRTRLSAP